MSVPLFPTAARHLVSVPHLLIGGAVGTADALEGGLASGVLHGFLSLDLAPNAGQIALVVWLTAGAALQQRLLVLSVHIPVRLRLQVGGMLYMCM